MELSSLSAKLLADSITTLTSWVGHRAPSVSQDGQHRIDTTLSALARARTLHLWFSTANREVHLSVQPLASRVSNRASLIFGMARAVFTMDNHYEGDNYNCIIHWYNLDLYKQFSLFYTKFCWVELTFYMQTDATGVVSSEAGNAPKTLANLSDPATAPYMKTLASTDLSVMNEAFKLEAVAE